MSYALGHFSLGAMLSLVLFRIMYHQSERIKKMDYLRYDLFIASMGGLWAMMPDMPSLFGVMEELVGGSLGNIFFFHSLLDDFDIHDSFIVSALLFGLFLLTVNLLNLDMEK